MLLRRKWYRRFVRWCFSFFLSVGIELQWQRALILKMMSRVRCLTQVPTAQQSLNISGKVFQELGC